MNANPLTWIRGFLRRVVAAALVLCSGIVMALVSAVKSSLDGEYSVEDQLATSDAIAEAVRKGSLGLVKVPKRS
jgi:hypothetical protein